MNEQELIALLNEIEGHFTSQEVMNKTRLQMCEMEKGYLKNTKELSKKIKNIFRKKNDEED